jgi:hypothetical protein
MGGLPGGYRGELVDDGDERGDAGLGAGDVVGVVLVVDDDGVGFRRAAG